MAIALDASSPAGVWGDTASNTSLVTASFTPPSGSIVVAFVFSAGGDQVHNTPTGLTFTAGPTAGTTTSTTKVSAFTATGGGSAVTVTASFSGTAEWRGLVVTVWTGAQLGSATNTVVGGSGAPTGTITTTGTNSVVLWACGDWNGQDGTGRTYRSSATEVAYHNIPGNIMTEYVARQAAATAGSQTYGLTAPSNQVYNLVALELQVPSGGSTFSAAGTSAAVTTTSGNPTRVPLTLSASGTSTVVSTTTGNPTRVGLTFSASGTSVVTSATSGDATRTPLTFSAAGTVTVVSTTSGNPTRVPLTLSAAGTSVVTSTTTGDATRVPLTLSASGTSVVVTTTSGSPSIVGGPVTLPAAGVVAAVSQAIGDITAKFVASGSTAVVSATTGNVTAQLAASGSTTVVSAVSGDVTVSGASTVYAVSGTVTVTTGAYGSVTVSGSYTFTPPTVTVPVTENPMDRLWSRVSKQRGVVVQLHLDGRVTTADIHDPDLEPQLAAFWLGGRTYPITTEQRDLLTAAGYGSGIGVATHE